MKKLMFILSLLMSTNLLAIDAQNQKVYAPEDIEKVDGLLYDNYGELVNGDVVFDTIGGKIILSYENGKIGNNFRAYKLSKKILLDVKIQNGIAVSGIKSTKDDKDFIPLNTEQLEKITKDINWFTNEGIDSFKKPKDDSTDRNIKIDNGDSIYSIYEISKKDGLLYDSKGKLLTGLLALKSDDAYFYVGFKDGKPRKEIMKFGLDQKPHYALVYENGRIVKGVKTEDGENIPIPEDELEDYTLMANHLFETDLDEHLKYAAKWKKDDSLYQNADSGNLEEVKKLIQEGADVNYVCSTHCSGWTPAMIAAANNHPEVLKYLLDKGANPNAQNSLGRTALHFAVIYNFTDIVQILLKANANPNLQSNEAHAPNTPVKAALSNKNAEILTLLLKAGGDKNADFNGVTPTQLTNELNDSGLKELLKK